MASTGEKALPVELRRFVANQNWTFAKTYARTWPHEYIVRDKVDERFFVRLVKHIRANGYRGHFYSKEITYFNDEGLVYWTMGAPVAETVIINRCMEEQTYEYRLARGDLPS